MRIENCYSVLLYKIDYRLAAVCDAVCVWTRDKIDIDLLSAVPL